MNFFKQGLPLGRWFRITVVVHWTFFLFAAFELYGKKGYDLLFNSLFLVLLFATVLVHEFGHALACRAVGGEAFHIVLWPLGGIAFVQPPMNPRAWLITTLCGPLVNAVLWPVFWALSVYVSPHLLPPPGVAPSLAVVIVTESFRYMVVVNSLLLIFNLIPAYPMDGGRILQEILWFFIGYPKSLHISGMVGTVCGAGFVVLGFGLTSITIPIVHYRLGDPGHSDYILIIIGLLVVSQSFGIYRQSQQIAGWRKN